MKNQSFSKIDSHTTDRMALLGILRYAAEACAILFDLGPFLFYIIPFLIYASILYTIQIMKFISEAHSDVIGISFGLLVSIASILIILIVLGYISIPCRQLYIREAENRLI